MTSGQGRTLTYILVGVCVVNGVGNLVLHGPDDRQRRTTCPRATSTYDGTFSCAPWGREDAPACETPWPLSFCMSDIVVVDLMLVEKCINVVVVRSVKESQRTNGSLYNCFWSIVLAHVATCNSRILRDLDVVIASCWCCRMWSSALHDARSTASTDCAPSLFGGQNANCTRRSESTSAESSKSTALHNLHSTFRWPVANHCM